MKIRLFLVSLLAIFSLQILRAEEYVVIAKDSKLFDTPIASNEYATKNGDDADCLVRPGMTLRLVEHKKGWDVVEYSPGLRAMVMQTILLAPASVKVPAPGNYNVANNPKERVTVTNTGADWLITSGTKHYKGKRAGNAVVFLNNKNELVYSLLNIGKTPYVYNYTNEILKFF